MRKFFAFALVLVVVLVVNTQADAQAVSGKGYSAEVPFERRSATTQIFWRNGAGRDTSIRLFTGAAALADTGNENIWVGGANTITLFDSIGVREDTVAYFQVYPQFSPDKSAWFNYLRGTGAGGAVGITVRLITAWAAADSANGAMGLTTTTSGANAVMSMVNLASPPSYANWMRLIARKHNSGATDTVTIKTKVAVHFGDE